MQFLAIAPYLKYQQRKVNRAQNGGKILLMLSLEIESLTGVFIGELTTELYLFAKRIILGAKSFAASSLFVFLGPIFLTFFTMNFKD